MTTRIESEVARVRDGALQALRTFESEFVLTAEARLRLLTRTLFPSPKYRDNPLGFFREVLGVEPWSKQIEIIEAIRIHDRISVKSGHKVSKSHTASGIALWFYCSFDDARAILTSTTARQVDGILWRECRMMRARSGLCVECKKENEQRSALDQIQVPCVHSALIDGTMGELARTGLKSKDFREIQGFTAREAEGVAGVSGRNLLYILDEASGIKEDIFTAVEGNRAGGAKILMFSNPTRTTGEFYESHTSKKRFYSCHTISSEETPNAMYGDDDPRAIPGLAGRPWIEEKKEEWGEDSALYKVRVKGEFAELEQGKVFSIHDIAESEARWHDTVAEGRLFIGLDPAGSGPSGDEIAWSLRRGLKQIALITLRGLSEQAILMHTLGIIREHRNDKREIPVLLMDREGKIGAEVWGTFRAFVATQQESPFELYAIRASDKSHHNPIVYDRMRDGLAGNLVEWMMDGGAIIEDTKQSKELHAFEWIELERTGRVKITPKKDIKKELGRSPDRYDALALCAWVPASLSEHGETEREDTIADADRSTRDGGGSPAMDPYAGSDQWSG